MKIRIINNQTTTVTRYAERDEWDHDDTHTTHDIEGIKIDPMNWNLDTTFDVKRGITYYLLYAIYSTGDSFGHSSQSSIEYFDLYETLEAAEAAKAEISAWEESKRYVQKAYSYTLACGKQMSMGWVPWFGYFEHLDQLGIQEVRLNG